jgi:hypothetical protein
MLAALAVDQSRAVISSAHGRPRRVLIEEAADSGWGIGDNVLTVATRNEHDRTEPHRGAFGSYGAPFDTR